MPTKLGFLAVILMGLSTAGPQPAAAQIVAPAGRTLFNEGVLVRALLRYDSFDEPVPGTELERFRSVWAVVWGARPHLSLSLVAPLVRVHESGLDSGRTRTGTADSTIFARYDALRWFAPAGYARLSPEIGIKLPTGGAFGTGSTDLLAGLVFSRVRDPHWLVADVQWTAFGEADGGLRHGDRWRADVAYLRRLVPGDGPGVPMVLLVTELNLESAGRSHRDGVVSPASGGRVLSFSPGIEWIVSRRVVVEAAVPIAIDEELRGDQPKPRASLILGARWLF